MATFISETDCVPPLLNTAKFFVRMSACQVRLSSRLTLVVVLLETGHFDTKDRLGLGRELLDDVLLETTNHEGLKLTVQGLDLDLLLSVTQLKVVGQLELFGLHEVKKRKKF
jgi:hypothetical protein